MKANRLSDINVRLYNNENIHSRDSQCTKVNFVANLFSIPN